MRLILAARALGPARVLRASSGTHRAAPGARYSGAGPMPSVVAPVTFFAGQHLATLLPAAAARRAALFSTTAYDGGDYYPEYDGEDRDDGAPPVNPRDACKVFVANLAWDVSSDDLAEVFASCGEVVDTNVLTFADSGKSKGMGFVEFSRPDAVQAALAMADTLVNDRPIAVEQAGKPRPRKVIDHQRERRGRQFRDSPMERRRSAEDFQDTRVFVESLSYDTQWPELKDYFKQIGDVVYASVSERPDGSSKGCGVVQFETKEEAQRAIELLNGSELGGRPIVVREDRQERGKRANEPRDGSDSWARANTRSRVSGSAPQRILPGDWECSGCGAVVFAKKTVCFICNTPKGADSVELVPTDGAGVEGQAFKDGDWNCPDCNAHVFASKGNASNAAAPTPTAPRPAGEGAGAAGRRGAAGTTADRQVRTSSLATGAAPIATVTTSRTSSNASSAGALGPRARERAVRGGPG
eukprot:CAMPEP_0182901446 /NCGR_PEP_ID=MMETSP0034_2-20130328/29651_1 /TAXON_ID=156128 /ORGANISM="Nephroselmis pyriformis, Strain CCMP717" /LENGTH=469 /DNA_ID=CAMNT_0025035859 /DNA_START=46 /DNA_END=1452 /DNA_ORIENTATION=-